MGSAAPQPHILLVDDTPGILEVMAEILMDEGYHVSVSRAPLAPPDLAKLAPDLIVQDLIYGGTPDAGWSDLTLAQLDPALARIPRLLCTAASEQVKEPDMAANLDRLGIRVLLKPFLIEDLLAAVANALTAQRLLDRVWSSQDGAKGSAGPSSWDGSIRYATPAG